MALVLAAGVLAANLFIGGVMLYALVDAKTHRQAEVAGQLDNLARLFDLNMAGSVDKIDLTLHETAYRLEREERDKGTISSHDGAALLADWRAWISGIATLRVIDETGTIRYEPPGVATGAPFIMADRPYFLRHRDDAFAGLVISNPVIGLVNRFWLISLSRRINHPDGSFGGIVSASVSLHDFAQLLSNMDLGPSGIAELWDSDDGLIARFANGRTFESDVGAKTLPAKLKAIIGSGDPVRTLSSDVGADGKHRFELYHRLTSVPFHLVIGMADDDYLAQWRTDVEEAIAVQFIVLLVTVFLARLLWQTLVVLDHSRRRSDMLLHHASDGIHILDADGNVIDASDSFCRMLGYERDQVLAMNVADWDWTLSPEELSRLLKGQIGSGATTTFETRFRTRDGLVRDIEITNRPVLLDGQWVLHNAARDITERKESDQQIRRLKDIYAALSQTNQCIVRCQSRDELFKTICGIAIRFGHFRMAWIGLIDAARNTVDPIEWAGEGLGYLEGLRISTDPSSPFHGGPVSQAVIRGKFQVINDYVKATEHAAWHERAKIFGFRSLASFPLHTKGRIIGALNLYSSEVDFFRAELVDLLDEMAFDISHALDRLQTEAERKALEFELAKLSLAVEQSPVTVIMTDLNGNIQYANPAFTIASGYERDEVLGRNPRFLASGETPKAEYEDMWNRIKGGAPWRGRFHNRRKDGTLFWEEAVVAPVRDADGTVKKFIGIKQDITKRVEAEENLAFLAHYDPLTGLPNRLLGKDRVERALVAAERNRSRTALMIVDIDHFKRINDSLGHAIGDQFLKAVVERLLVCIRETDTVTRQAGDEFMVVLSSVLDTEAVNRVAAEILEAMLPPFHIAGQALSSSVSIGIAVYPDDGRDFDTLLRRADAAMDAAKDAGRNTYRFFAQRMNANASEYLAVLTSMRKALENSEFTLHFQPQISLVTNAIVGAEALIRWNHPELGLLLPAKFISVAEDSGMIVDIGEWVLHESCRQAMRWRDLGHNDLTIAVNLSAVQFRRGDLLAAVTRALAETSLPPNRLELELTESILIHDTANVLSTVTALKALGVKLSIDDFGTGYSSLAYLRRFALDRLKIDQSFVRGIARDPNNDVIVRAIVQLAKGLGLKAVAEGVEDQETLDVIRRHGCDEVQGYHFARPMPAEDFPAFAAAFGRGDEPERT
jgi:diguanylate cyclase (GGDEF)-like protein/PAS domain S-box-containing protein